ncbi:MAG: hypothetical protein OCC49_11545 [Fibrobacterales bacterium]
MKTLILLLILFNSHTLFAIVPLLESLAFPKQLILPRYTLSLDNPLYHLSTFDTLHYAFKYHDDNILHTNTSHISSTSSSHTLFLTIGKIGTIYGGLNSYSSRLSSSTPDVDSLSLTHYSHKKYIGLYLQGYTPFITKFEYQSNGTITGGLGIAQHLLIEGSYHSEIKEDSLHLWTEAFRTNSYPAIDGTYRAHYRKATIQAHGAYHRHFISLIYGETQSTPSTATIDYSAPTQSHYWLADSSSANHYGATYHYAPLNSTPHYHASIEIKTGTTTTMGFRQNTTHSFGINTKKYHNADFYHNLIDSRLSATFFSPTVINSFSIGGEYLSYQISTSNNNRNNRLNDFLRYNTLFPSQLSTILVSSYFNQSDFITSSLRIQRLTLPLSITHLNRYGSVTLTSPLAYHSIKTSLIHETYTIPTFFLSAPTLNSAMTYTVTGKLISIPFQVSYTYSMGTITMSITANQIIPLWNSIKAVNTQESSPPQSLKIKEKNYSLAKNGFSIAYSTKISF